MALVPNDDADGPCAQAASAADPNDPRASGEGVQEALAALRELFAAWGPVVLASDDAG